MAKPFKRKGSRFWWIAPWIDGKQVRQSTGETEYDRAERKLKILEGKIAANAPITAKTDRGSFTAILELVRVDYKIKRRRSLHDLELRLDSNLIPALGHHPAGRAWQELPNYILERQTEDEVENSTINRELAIVKRAYRLGARNGMVSFVPHIEMLPEENERENYFSKDQFALVCSFAPPLVCNILTVAYVTGWRIKSILSLQWQQVDLKSGFVWLNASETKNIKATRWPLDVMGLRAIFEEQKAATEAVKNSIVPWVFHRKGRRVISFKNTWNKIREAAKVPAHVVHDFRGTAIINLLESGVEDSTIMNMVGLKTQAMVIRYAKKRGMREDRLREAGKLLEMRMRPKSDAK